MRILVPLFALLLLGGTATAQQSRHKKVQYHVSWTDQHGVQKCHNGASKEQAEKNAARMRGKKGFSNVSVGEGKCDRDGKPSATPAVEAKPRPVKPVPSTTPMGTAPVDQKPVQSKPMTTVPAEREPMQSKPTGTAPVDQKPVQSKPMTTVPAEREPMQSKPTGRAPVDQKPVQSKPTTTVPAEQEAMQSKPATTEPAVIAEPSSTRSTKLEPATGSEEKQAAEKKAKKKK